MVVVTGASNSNDVKCFQHRAHSRWQKIRVECLGYLSEKKTINLLWKEIVVFKPDKKCPNKTKYCKLRECAHCQLFFYVQFIYIRILWQNRIRLLQNDTKEQDRVHFVVFAYVEYVA